MRSLESSEINSGETTALALENGYSDLETYINASL